MNGFMIVTGKLDYCLVWLYFALGELKLLTGTISQTSVYSHFKVDKYI
jgi:hypothetical protein